MGILFSREKTDSSDYEQVLSKLEKDIQKVEQKLSEFKIKQRKASFLWIIYALVIWTVCLLYLFYKFVDDASTTQDLLYGLIPVVLLPVGIYHVRKLLVWWYDSRQKKEEAILAKLRKDQKDKLEDLKNKTSYYKTQSLLEKYDDDLQKKKKQEQELQQRMQQQQQQQQRKPVSLPPMRQQPQQPQAQPQNGMIRQQPPILPPQPRSEPQWYDKIVDALVGETGPETKYALICNHCFSHNGLVLKEEYDTIQYVCPVCKQFNPSRKSKQDIIDHKKQEDKQAGENTTIVEEEEEEDNKVIEKMKQEFLSDDHDDSIGSRVRQRHHKASDTEDQD